MKTIKEIQEELKEGNLSKYSVLTYVSKIKNILNLLDEDDIEKVLNKPLLLIKKINSNDKWSGSTKNTYLKTIVGIIKNVKSLDIADKNIDRYKNEMMKNIKKQTVADEKKISSDEAIKWEVFENIYKEEKKNKKINQRFLLIALYVLLPPNRDDYGNVLILNKIDRTRMEKLDNNRQNYYIKSVGRFIFNSYKTYEKFGKRVINSPLELKRIINKSLKQNPRDYLITQDNNTTNVIYEDGKISHLIRKLFNYSINDFRHSYITEKIYNNKIKLEDQKNIAYQMGHSINTQLTYQREG